MPFSPAMKQTLYFPGGTPQTPQAPQAPQLPQAPLQQVFGQQTGGMFGATGGMFGSGGQFAAPPQSNALEGLQSASTDPNHPWAQFFSHPAVQNALTSLFPQQGAPGAQPNWLGNMSGQQQQGAMAGPSAENPVAGNNFMGGSW